MKRLEIKDEDEFIMEYADKVSKFYKDFYLESIEFVKKKGTILQFSLIENIDIDNLDLDIIIKGIYWGD